MTWEQPPPPIGEPAGEPANLPQPVPNQAPRQLVLPGYSSTDPLRLVGGFSGTTRAGRWEVPPYLLVETVAANVRIDCLQGTTRTQQVDLELVPGLGSAILVLPEGWAVNVDRLGKSLGTVKVRVPTVPAWGCPLIVVRGSVGMGSFRARPANWWEQRRLSRSR